MTAQERVDRVIVQLRGQVAELRRMEETGTRAEEIDERRRVIVGLQERLSRVVLDGLGGSRDPLPH